MDKNEVMKTMVDVRFEPFVNHQELKEYQYINASDIVNLGAIAQIVPSVMEGLKKNEGLYKVIMPKGAHLAKDAHGLYLGGTFDSKNHLIGQARWQKVEGLQGISPEVLSSGVACVMIIAVEHELNEIKEMQKQILSYLEEKDIAELVSNTSNLQDIQKDYKYNLEALMHPGWLRAV